MTDPLNPLKNSLIGRFFKYFVNLLYFASIYQQDGVGGFAVLFLYYTPVG